MVCVSAHSHSNFHSEIQSSSYHSHLLALLLMKTYYLNLSASGIAPIRYSLVYLPAPSMIIGSALQNLFTNFRVSNPNAISNSFFFTVLRTLRWIGLSAGLEYNFLYCLVLYIIDFGNLLRLGKERIGIEPSSLRYVPCASKFLLKDPFRICRFWLDLCYLHLGYLCTEFIIQIFRMHMDPVFPNGTNRSSRVYFICLSVKPGRE